MHKGIRISAAAAGLTMLIGASGVPTAEAADRLSERASAQLLRMAWLSWIRPRSARRSSTISR